MLEAASPLARWRQRIFALSWLSYFSYYFTRKHFSAVKSSLGIGERWLQWIDFSYLVGYCAGQFAAGALGDVVGARRMVTAGMLASALLTLLFAAADSLTGMVIVVYLSCSAANGLVQATGWPGNGKLMAVWYPPATRGEVMGYWGTCYQLGGLAATAAAGALLVLGWRVVYVAAAAWVTIVALVYWRWVRDTPAEAGLPHDDGRDHAQVARVSAEPTSAALLRREQWLAILRQPLTYALGLSYFGLKLMRYGFLFWLPYYLNVSLGYGKSEAAYVSIAFELGGVLFVIVAGLVADRLLGRRRILVATGCAALLFFALMAYRALGTGGVAINIATLMLVGGFLFGADTLVSGAAAQDLGGPQAASLACGLINGLGSVGAVVQGLVLLPVKDAWGWDGVFIMFQGMAVLSFVALLPFVKTRPP